MIYDILLRVVTWKYSAEVLCATVFFIALLWIQFGAAYDDDSH